MRAAFKRNRTGGMMINGALVQAFSLSVSLSLSVSINAVTTQRVPPLWPSQKKKKGQGQGLVLVLDWWAKRGENATEAAKAYEIPAGILMPTS